MSEAIGTAAQDVAQNPADDAQHLLIVDDDRRIRQLLKKFLQAEGYRVTNAPADSGDLMRRILAGPTNWLTDRAQRQGGVSLSLIDYSAAYSRLPWDLRVAIESRWGGPERDPFFVPGETDCGHFALSVLDFGHVVVGVQPSAGVAALSPAVSFWYDLLRISSSMASATASACLRITGSALDRPVTSRTVSTPASPTPTTMMNMISSIRVSPRWATGIAKRLTGQLPFPAG